MPPLDPNSVPTQKQWLGLEHLENVISEAARFDVAILDASRFFVVRRWAEQRDLIKRLEQAGWMNPEPMIGTYWCFRKESPQRSGDDDD